MKKLFFLFFLTISIIGCSKQKELPLFEKIKDFKVSECKNNCGIDSIGVRRNEIKNGHLFIKLGYIVNCSWEKGFVSHISQRHDTMYIELDRPHNIDTTQIDDNTYETVETYPIYDCDCFHFFNLTMNDMSKTPEVIRVSPTYEKEKFWDLKPYHYLKVEETKIEIE